MQPNFAAQCFQFLARIVIPYIQLLLLHHMCVILQACEPAAKLALEDVNAKSDLLPGYTLRLHWNDSGVSIFQSLCVFCDTT